MQFDRPQPGADGQHITFCRICEALCGMIVEVEDGRIKKIGPDRLNPHSTGHICIKGPAMADVVHDPDRLRTPLKRSGGPGHFAPVSWDEALSDIAKRFAAIRDDHGGKAIASYFGNPAAFNLRALFGGGALYRALGISKFFNTGSQDTTARYVASYILYGDVKRTPIPDLERCNMLLMLGSNPLISHGSMLTVPRLREALDAIAKRGRVIVVDPRRTETAERFEHLTIRPGTDPWLLSAMIGEIRRGGKLDMEFISAATTGSDRLFAAIDRITPELAERHCGVSADRIRQLAADFAASQSVAYGRVGLCRGRFSTLSNFLLDALNIVCGRFSVAGGSVFGHSLSASVGAQGPSGYGAGQSRIADLPTVAGSMPSVLLAPEILEPGAGRVRGLLSIAGNPVLSAPGGEQLEKALSSLDLFVAIDIFMNESNRFADYILPATTFLERADLPSIPVEFMPRPFLQFTHPVLPPQGDVREEGDVLASLASLIDGRDIGTSDPFQRFDSMLRAGPFGDQGQDEAEGLSLEKVKQAPHDVWSMLRLIMRDGVGVSHMAMDRSGCGTTSSSRSFIGFARVNFVKWIARSFFSSVSAV